MQAWALWVQRRINHACCQPQRQAVLAAAATERQALDEGIALQARLTGLSDRFEWGLRLWVRIKC